MHLLGNTMLNNFLGKLPWIKRGHDYIFVVVDRFNNIAILMSFQKIILEPKVMTLLFFHS